MCSATGRVLVHENIKDQFMAALVDKLKQIKICDSLSDDVKDFSGPQMGPVVSEGQYLKIWKYIDDAKAAGLNFFYGGDRSMVADINGGKGFFVPPLVIDEPPISSAVWREEIFGPVLCTRSFKTEEVTWSHVQIFNHIDIFNNSAVFYFYSFIIVGSHNRGE